MRGDLKIRPVGETRNPHFLLDTGLRWRDNSTVEHNAGVCCDFWWVMEDWFSALKPGRESPEKNGKPLNPVA